jgi:hypothetical protein
LAKALCCPIPIADHFNRVRGKRLNSREIPYLATKRIWQLFRMKMPIMAVEHRFMGSWGCIRPEPTLIILEVFDIGESCMPSSRGKERW